MPPDDRRIGAHLPLGLGMVKAADRAHAIGATTLQVFSDNPTAWRRRANPPKELAAFRGRLTEHGIAPLAIHASYLVNLAGPDEELYARSVDLLASELRMAHLFGARFVNVHIGSHRGTGIEAGVERVADGIRRVLDSDEAGTAAAEASVSPEFGAEQTESVGVAARDGLAPVVVLENSAGGGYGIGTNVEELATIHDAALARGVPRERIGFCLDTAHLWGAGHDISDPAVLDALLDQFDERIGLDRLVMIHLNDSRAGLGSHFDRHQHLAAGRIGPLGMGHVLRHPRLAHVAYYVETPGMDEGYDEVNVRRALDLVHGRPLEELPPEALTMKGSRSRSAPVDDE